ncbi:unnamed protein product [Aureobasidium uvarum]|uniref:Antifreeze protein n=1 Tax=Aureobasidium uvarum TaxID=2773716 RepID=A0A9N8KP78_9PEZI|nr:unnamed protein product [Aureobasidium uvarum]
MKTLSLLIAIPALVSAAKCNADNCARALTGTVDGPARASSRINTDCSSFQLTTVYPAATTITTTSGSVFTTIVPDTAGLTIAPSYLPSYANAACTPSGIASARFASACSCAGVSAATTTAATPTATVVVPVFTCNNPLNANTGANIGTNTCSRGASDACTYYCDQDISGGGVCVQNAGCGPSCSSDSDCGSGNVCVTNTFCGYSNCVSASACGGQRRRGLQKKSADLTNNIPPSS